MPVQQCGDLELFWPEFPQFAVEAHQKHGPNIVIFRMVMGGPIWFLMGLYLAPDNASSIEHAFGAMVQCPNRDELVVFGDLNRDIVEPEGNTWYKSIVVALVDLGPEDIYIHFLPCRIPWA